MSKVELIVKEITRPAPSFYRIYGRDLAVAVRVTFPGDAVIRPTDESFKFPELINPSPEIHLTREERRYTDLPAMADVDMSLDGKEEGEISFRPWFDVTEAKVPLYSALDEEARHASPFHIVFRIRPMALNSSKFRWIKFGRFGEESDFGFVLFGPRKKHFINLGLEVFDPVYIKVAEKSGFCYLKIVMDPDSRSGENPISRIWEGKPVILKTRRVTEQDVPPHLIKSLP